MWLWRSSRFRTGPHTFLRADVVAGHGVGFHQFADDMQLYVAITSTNADLDRLQRCSDDFQAWYLQNDLLLNQDKSEVLVFGTSSSLRSVAGLSTVKVAGVHLRIASDMKSLGVVLDSQLTFENHVQAVCRACNYHLWALRHIRHLLLLKLWHAASS